MANSINTNVAAYYAQANITAAANASASSVARLSSGNRIVQASDDVAALSIGTSLQTTVSALRTAQTNASQGTSLLQVADGALAQIQNILQQQKSIALQAASGSLTDTDRGFLNQQFQALSSQIDSLSGSTSFNGVKLLDGSVSGKIGLVSNITNSTAASNADANIATIATNAAAGETITVNGVVVNFVANTVVPGSAQALGNVIIGASVTATAANVVAYLNNLGDPRLANLQFNNTAGAIAAQYRGGSAIGAVTFTTSASNTTSTTGTGAQTFTATTFPDTTNATGLGLNRYGYSGPVTGNLLANGGTAVVDSGQALNLGALINNSAFVGKFSDLGAITGTFNAVDAATFSFQAGGITYTTASTTITGGAAPIALTFTGRDAGGNLAGGAFTINLRGTAITATTVTGQSTLNPIVAQINDSLREVTVTQNRTITSFQNGATVLSGGVQSATLQGASATLTSGDFTGVSISSIQVTAPSAGTTDAKFSVVINGETFVSGSGIGNQINRNTVIGLQSASDPSKSFAITTGATGFTGNVAFDLSTQAKADALADALKQAFGLDNANASLSFQIGATSTDVIGVSIGSAKTSDIFGGNVYNVSTQIGAQAAAAGLDSAISSVTSLRANVGALETQFSFASAALQSSVQNQDAARGALLDTDVAAESTAFATQQVKLQAGISVLAQANQQLQALLKLIG